MIEELSDIKEETSETVTEEIEPTAVITAGTYDFTTGNLPVIISQIQDAPDTIQSVKIAVWTQEDQSDLQWIQTGMDENGNFAGITFV